jgi:hypothetical protein
MVPVLSMEAMQTHNRSPTQSKPQSHRVSCLDVLNKEVEVLCTHWVERVSAASVRLEFREVVIQEILLDLSSG